MALKKYVWFLIAGILLLAIDIPVSVGEPYPEMIKDANLGDELQGKIVNNFIGEKPTVDIISDVVGYLLIVIGCILMLKTNKNFALPLLFVPIAIILLFIIPQLPYKYQMEKLYLKFAGFTFLIVFIQILIEFLVIRAVIKVTKSLQNEWYTNEMLIGWILAMAIKGILIFIRFFYGRNLLYIIFTTIMILATIFYMNRLSVVLKNYYQQEEETL